METNLDDIKPELTNYLGAKRALVGTMTSAFRSGAPAMAVWRSVAPAFSRDQVKEYLAAVALADSARKALGEAGLANDVNVFMTGIDAPREARLVIAAEPAEVADYRALAERVRSALRDFHITLACSQGGDTEATEALVNELLLDGEPVRLTKLKPRT